MRPVYPGEILREDFMKPLDLTANKLALELHVPATRIGEIVHGRYLLLFVAPVDQSPISVQHLCTFKAFVCLDRRPKSTENHTFIFPNVGICRVDFYSLIASD